jgi:hypothetical protein
VNAEAPSRPGSGKPETRLRGRGLGDGTVRCDRERIGERREHAKSTIVNRNDDAEVACAVIIPKPLRLHVIGGAGGGDHLERFLLAGKPFRELRVRHRTQLASFRPQHPFCLTFVHFLEERRPATAGTERVEDERERSVLAMSSDTARTTQARTRRQAAERSHERKPQLRHPRTSFMAELHEAGVCLPPETESQSP